jgi:hypothetical protein
MKLTINQKTDEKLYRGEDKEFILYLYDGKIFEPISLISYTDIKVTFLNADNTSLVLTGDVTGLNAGQIKIIFTGAESILLALGKQKIQLNLEDSAGPTLDLEVFDNVIEVVDPVFPVVP